MKPDEKDKVMNLLKELSNSIDKTKEDIRNMISVSGLKKRTKAEVKHAQKLENLWKGKGGIFGCLWIKQSLLKDGENKMYILPQWPI